MFDNCYKYKEKGSVKKKKNKNKENYNCYEEDEKKKPKYPKCSKSRRQPVLINHLDETETILLRIQPTIADRERYLNPHINCVREELEEPCPKKSKEEPYLLRSSKSKSKPFTSAKERGKTSKKANEKDKRQIEEREKTKVNRTEEQQKQKENTERKKENDDKQQNTVFENTKEDEGMKRDYGTTKKKSEYQNVKRKKKSQLKQHTTDKDSDFDMSICSDDSEICLVDLSLTKEEKNRMEENRRRLRPLTDDKKNESDEVTN